MIVQVRGQVNADIVANQEQPQINTDEFSKKYSPQSFAYIKFAVSCVLIGKLTFYA
jgi:hypothetical protein